MKHRNQPARPLQGFGGAAPKMQMVWGAQPPKVQKVQGATRKRNEPTVRMQMTKRILLHAGRSADVVTLPSMGGVFINVFI